MVVRDASPETIAKFTQPQRAAKTVAPVVDALDQHMRSSKGMVMGQGMAAPASGSSPAFAHGGGSRPGSAKPAIFAGGAGGSRPASKQQQRHRIACDSVFPDGPPAQPAAGAPPPGAASFGASGGFDSGPKAANGSRRGGGGIPEEFAALGLGSSGSLAGVGGGGGHGGGSAGMGLASGPGRRIQGMPFPDATVPMGGKAAAPPSFNPSFMAQAESLKKQSGAYLSQFAGTGQPAPAGGGYHGFNPLPNMAGRPPNAGGGIFR
jgi:hypothetical protein